MLRIYRTPGGYRILVAHRPFEPAQPAVLSRTPQREAEAHRYRIASALPTGVWPIKTEHLPSRERWLANYDAAAKSHCAWRVVERVGTGVVHADVAPVLALNDELSGAISGRPIARSASVRSYCAGHIE